MVMRDTTTNQTSKNTRSEVWGELYAAEYAFLYYEQLERKFLKTHQVFSWTSIALGGGAIAPALLLAFASDDATGGYFGWWFAIQGIALAVITLVDKVGKYDRKASVASNISKSCSQVASDLANLFSDIDQRNVDDTWARSRLDHLVQLKREITNSGQTAEIVVDNESDVSKKVADIAADRLADRYA